MRFLICPGGDYGNLHPMVPLASAIADRGHDVAFAISPIDVARVQSFGFDAFPVGPSGGSLDEFPEGVLRELQDLDEVGRATRSIDGFAALAQNTVPDLAALIEAWKPDALVQERTAFAAWIAGELAGVPVALFDFTGFPPSLVARVAGPSLNRLREAFGLGSDPSLETMYRWLVLVGAPPELTDLEFLSPTAHLIQPPEFDRATIEPRPAWLDSLPAGRRIVYATLGTVFADTPGAWEAIFTAVADESELFVIATVGPLANPDLGSVPENVRVERYLPQSHVLDVADVVIAHGGYGSLMGALRRGLPIVSLPMPAADNLLHASRLAALGAAIIVPQDDRTSTTIRDALRRVVAEPAFRDAARRIAAAMAALPSADFAAELVERLATTRRPVNREATTRTPGD